MSPDLIALATNSSMALITFLSGCLIAATPWLTRGREAFAVSVPETAQADPRIQRMRRIFLASVLAISNGVKYEGYPTSKQTRIFGFEPHQSEICDFKPEVIIDITETMEMKKAAMNCFKAQSHLIEYYGMKAFMRGNHARRISGCQDYKFAEAFTRRFPYVGEYLV